LTLEKSEENIKLPAFPLDQCEDHGNPARVSWATVAIESNERTALADSLCT
jgi:hypothetical protein